MAFITGFSAAKMQEDITLDLVRKAGLLLGFSFSESQTTMMMPMIRSHMQSADALRTHGIDHSIPPALTFNPLPKDFHVSSTDRTTEWDIPGHVILPENFDEIAFYSIPELASLLRSGLITSEELTIFFLHRLKKYGDTLECVASLTEQRALARARLADQEMASGIFRGPLHGIPYGVKDLLAVADYPTSWGARPYKGQYLDYTATVVQKLDEAGAILVAKLTLGALAMGDVWHGGQTRNPWNLEQGSSGSSAGSAAAVSAGLVPFAIGSETLGSIVSPSTRCGVTGLRPTFGRVSRWGAMPLSWSMDKIGPIARSAKECAMVFEAIQGSDGLDNSLIDAGFFFDPETDISTLRVGYFHELFKDDHTGLDPDKQVLADLRELGVELHKVEWSIGQPVHALRIILYAEAAAAFDELTTSGRDSLLVSQDMNAWPNFFRAARFIPAVEYINANRVRYMLMEEMKQLMADYHVIVTPSFAGNQLLVTNLTGHPCLVVPNGFSETGDPLSISFIGSLFGEDKILALAQAWQNHSGHNRARPPLFDPLNK
ncbi:MAG: amidase [Bacteroidia bacterium]|nr:MAG: amidase [Bacteroidia bacterium]